MSICLGGVVLSKSVTLRPYCCSSPRPLRDASAVCTVDVADPRHTGCCSRAVALVSVHVEMLWQSLLLILVILGTPDIVLVLLLRWSSTSRNYGSLYC